MSGISPEMIKDLADDYLLTPQEVAQLFRVDPKTVARWSQAGKIKAVRTIGGHRRFPVRELRRLLREDG